MKQISWIGLQVAGGIAALVALGWLFLDGGWQGMVIAIGVVVIGGWLWERSENGQRYARQEENSISHAQQQRIKKDYAKLTHRK